MREPFNYTWIEEGKILAGFIPTGIQDYQLMQDMGIRTLLSLTRRSVTDCEGVTDFFNANSWLWRHEPIPDGCIVDNIGMESAIRWIDHTYQMGRPQYIHCRGGIGRTGTILIGYYVLARGYSLADARGIVGKRHHPQIDINHAGPMSDVQREWVKHLPELNYESHY
jgi:Swiss Army Knife protein, DSP-PTPase phosphatase domain